LKSNQEFQREIKFAKQISSLWRTLPEKITKICLK
jgi:hypothetical protein